MSEQTEDRSHQYLEHLWEQCVAIGKPTDLASYVSLCGDDFDHAREAMASTLEAEHPDLAAYVKEGGELAGHLLDHVVSLIERTSYDADGTSRGGKDDERDVTFYLGVEDLRREKLQAFHNAQLGAGLRRLRGEETEPAPEADEPAVMPVRAACEAYHERETAARNPMVMHIQKKSVRAVYLRGKTHLHSNGVMW